MKTIYILEDNFSIRESVKSYLELEGYLVKDFETVSDTLTELKKEIPNLLILDVMLPDGNGFYLAKRVREFSMVPIIFLTAKESESDRITGFEIGGDDYVVKPFSTKELVYRVKSILKRTEIIENNVSIEIRRDLKNDSLYINEENHVVRINDMDVDLTAAEWKILIYLAKNKGNVYSRDQLLENCFDYYAEGSLRTIDTHIKNIRNKLGNPDWIETIRGYGYKFAD